MNDSRTPWARTVALAACVACAPAAALVVTIDSGPQIKTELLRNGGWSELAFNFAIPQSATGDGEFHLFAGGDLNNITQDWIDVTAGPFGDRTLLGTFAFPIGDVHFTACENPPHGNDSPCPVPENVPGGMFSDPEMTPVGDVQGRRNTTMFNAGIPGLIMPMELLVGGTNQQISLFVRDSIFDLYIDRMELRFPTTSEIEIPEPSAWSLVAFALAALALRLGSRRTRVAPPRAEPAQSCAKIVFSSELFPSCSASSC